MKLKINIILAAVLLFPLWSIGAEIKPDSFTCDVAITRDNKGNSLALTSIKITRCGVVVINECLPAIKVKEGKENKAISKAVEACEERVKKFEKAGAK